MEQAYTSVEEMSKRKLTDAEKRVISFMDVSDNRERSAYSRLYIEERPDGNFNLRRANQTLVCHPNTIISLAGKGFIKLKYGRIELVFVIYKRSIRALKRDGYFEDVM